MSSSWVENSFCVNTGDCSKNNFYSHGKDGYLPVVTKLKVCTLDFLINVLQAYSFLRTFSFQHALIQNNTFINFENFSKLKPL